MNRLFVVNKPIFRSSNGYMGVIKRRYGTKKVGFSGTLDPFATGCLIVATGQYTKLFNYLEKAPKTYRATLWLGVNSETLDIEKVDSIQEVPSFKETDIIQVLQSFQGKQTYYPPIYSAKKIGGKRAYELAREGKTVELKSITSMIYTITLICYNHPFVHFEATVSEGTYIRSLGHLIAQKLRVDGTLSSLARINEGRFHFEQEKALDPLDYLNIPRNHYNGEDSFLELGKKLSVEYFEKKEDGSYLVETAHFFAIIEIKERVVSYKLNRMEKFQEYPCTASTPMPKSISFSK